MKKIITIIATATILAACQQTDELDNAGTMPLNITADTRALNAAANISLNVGSGTKTYALGTDNSFDPAGADDTEKAANKIYIAPGTNTLPAYAWGTVSYDLDKTGNTPDIVAMPVLHANPTTPVKWIDDTDANNPVPSSPTIALALTPATTRIKLEIKGVSFDTNNGDKATLHGIATPKTETGGAYAWTTTMPPTLVNKDTDKKEVALDPDATYTPAIPGTIPTGAHMMTITIAGTPDSKTYPIISTQPYNFLPGYQYKLTVTINASGKAEITNITIEDFASGGGILIDGDNPQAATTHVIYNQATLEAFRDAVNATDGSGKSLNALQIASFTMAGDAWTQGIGTKNNPYEGTYNGGGCTITNFKLDGTTDYQGLFGHINNATIANVTIKEPVMTNTKPGLAALVGKAEGNATISHCHTTKASISGKNNYIGGLIGYMNGGIHVVNCSAIDVTVKGSEIPQGSSVGGLVGAADGSCRIVACHTSGSVTATSGAIGTSIGGLAGYNKGTIRFCYTTAEVKLELGNGYNSNAGGLVGLNDTNPASTSSCYATGDVTVDQKTGDPSRVGSLVGVNKWKLAYCNASGTASNGNLLIGKNDTGTDNIVGNTNHPQANTADILATLKNNNVGDLGTGEYANPFIRMWNPATRKVETYTFTKDVWTNNLTLDITKAIKQ